MYWTVHAEEVVIKVSPGCTRRSVLRKWFPREAQDVLDGAC